MLASEYVLPYVREAFKEYLLPRMPLWSFCFEVYSDRLDVGEHRGWWLEYVSDWRSWWSHLAGLCYGGPWGLVYALHVLHERRAPYAPALDLALPRSPTLILELLIIQLLFPWFSIGSTISRFFC